MEIRNLTQVDGTNKTFIFHLQNGENVSLPWTKKKMYTETCTSSFILAEH